MRTDAEQLKFVVRLAGADLNAYRPGDWQNLRDDLQLFLQDGVPDGEWIPHAAGREQFVSSEKVGRAPNDGLRQLQAEIAALLDQCVVARDATIQGRMDRIMGRPFSVALTRQLITVENNVSSAVAGKLRDVAMEKVYQLLIRHPIRPLQRCPAPNCGRIFYRVKKQLYCQRSCFVRAWLNTAEGKKTKRAADRKSAKNARRARVVARDWPSDHKRGAN